MAVIYKTTDRIAIKIDEITIKIRPLTIEEKSKVLAQFQAAQKAEDMSAIQQASLEPLRLGLKSIEGVSDASGETYQLQFEEGRLTDECVSDLLNMTLSDKLMRVCSSLLNGLPEDFKIDGVSYEVKASSKKKK